MRAATLLALLVSAYPAGASRVDSTAAINPIRRVVSMLQMMAKKVEAEGKKEKELFDKFMCWCETGGAALEASIKEAEEKIPQLESKIKEIGEAIEQLVADLKQHKKDRAEAQEAVANGEALRKKEHEAFLKESGDYKTNLAALQKAIAALEKGMAGAFLQTSAASALRRLTVTLDISPSDRDALSAFLSQGQGEAAEYAPQSGEIVGILKQMKDTMEKDLAEVVAPEEEAAANFDEMMKAKAAHVEELTKAIEDKTVRLGNDGVLLINLKEDLEDTTKSLAEDKKFLADLEKNCEIKKKEWAERSKTRAEELLAIMDTIKILNDDDALELFKKTLPSPSLIQMSVSNSEMRKRAAEVLSAVRGRGKARDFRVALIEMALKGGKVTFEKVISMIDDMVALLGKEQVDDDEKKAYCEAEIDKAEDEIKELERTVETLEKEIEDTKELIATLTEEIAALEQGIKDLDKAVAEATEQRKEEHEDFVESLAANNAAKDILGIAKNRLNKFYNPKLFKPAPKRELTKEERITVSLGGTAPPTAAPGGIAGTGVTALDQEKGAPAPPPATWDAYAKKSQESNGVMAMIDMLAADLDKEIEEMRFEEKDAQQEYEQFVADSAAKRAADSKSIEEKEGAKAGAEAELQRMEEEKADTMKAAMAKAEELKDLHLDCDWLLSNFEVRKEARAGEVDALKKAKAVLSGADYSLVQITARRLRGA